MSRLDGVSVLVIEDEVLIGAEIALVLTEAGASVIGPVTSLSKALETIAAHSFDAAVLDVRLGRDDVHDAARALADSNVPFLFQTGHADEKLLEAWPGRTILRKPVPPQQLVVGVAGLLGR